MREFRTARDLLSNIEHDTQSLGQKIHDLIEDLDDYAVQYEEIDD